MPVHLYGRPAPMGDLMADRASVTGSSSSRTPRRPTGRATAARRCGTIGAMACFSFYPGKNLGAYGDAGAVTSNDPDLLARVRKLRDHGRTSKYEHDEIGYGERIDALQAAILGAKLPHLTAWTDARRRHARRYTELLAGADVTTPDRGPARRARLPPLRHPLGTTGRAPRAPRRRPGSVPGSTTRSRSTVSRRSATSRRCSLPAHRAAAARSCRCRCSRS